MENNKLLTKIEEMEKLKLISTDEIITLRSNLSMNKLSVILFINVIYRLLIMIINLKKDVIKLQTTESDTPTPTKTKK